MKKAFTLLELLITIAVMATLMSMMFRLGTSATDENNKVTTIARLQKLENCLSGYYSAFGSYPPVGVYGSRDIYYRVEYGVQTDNRNETLNWEQVNEACRSQPVACAFPFSSEGPERERVEALSAEIQARAGEGSYEGGMKAKYNFTVCTPGDFTQRWNERDWRRVQIFKFGLMSYLLPRYLVMMSGDQEFYSSNGHGCGQWYYNNFDDPCSATDGLSMTRADLWQIVQMNQSTGLPERGMADYIKVANMPTQAVCGRWIANLKDMCVAWSNIRVFGITVASTSAAQDISAMDNPETLQIYSPDQGGNYYLLNSITVADGWHNDFYYYSPLGNQSYVLWSAGPNKKTFPPWMSKDKLPSGDRKTVIGWTEDDIMRMKH